MHYLKLSIKIAIILFVTGTIILLIFFFTGSAQMVRIGYTFLVTSIFTSWAFIALVLINFVRGKISMTNALKTLGVILINIPIAILYTYLVVQLLGYARITFINSTPHHLKAIKIYGCEENKIISLPSGESKTVWIAIVDDCDVKIDYEVQGSRRTETVAGYLTPSGGVKAAYEIGSNRDIFDDR